jgi:hypothetical protein
MLVIGSAVACFAALRLKDPLVFAVNISVCHRRRKASPAIVRWVVCVRADSSPHRLLEEAGIAEQADRPAGVQEDHALMLADHALAYQVDHPGHALA